MLTLLPLGAMNKHLLHLHVKQHHFQDHSDEKREVHSKMHFVGQIIESATLIIISIFYVKLK